MRLRLKNIKVEYPMTTPHLAFTGTLYLDDKKVGIVSSNGEAGGTKIVTDNEKGEKLLAEAREYFSSRIGSNRNNDKESTGPAISVEMAVESLVSLAVKVRRLKDLRATAKRERIKNIVSRFLKIPFPGRKNGAKRSNRPRL